MTDDDNGQQFLQDQERRQQEEELLERGYSPRLIAVLKLLDQESRKEKK